jgi:hypothetical protein
LLSSARRLQCDEFKAKHVADRLILAAGVGEFVTRKPSSTLTTSVGRMLQATVWRSSRCRLVSIGQIPQTVGGHRHRLLSV